MPQPIGVGLAGSGFMGRAHAVGLRMVGGVFDLKLRPELRVLADSDEERAHAAARRLGFASSTGDWRRMVADNRVELVDITTPNALHAPIALAAIERGKHVYCEKPLAPTAGEARGMAEAAERAGIVTQVGFNYICNPMLALARDMIAAGELGRVWSFRGIHAEDFMRDSRSPWSWRLDPSSGGGALADLGSHIIGMARYLLGPFGEICADLDTAISERPGPSAGDPLQPVLVDDQARLLVRFAQGARGTIEASWLASGRKMQLGFEVSGERGALVFSQARLNELLFYRVEPDGSRNGFRRIEAGPEHPPYAAFCPAGGHQLGFNELKVIEIRGLLEAIAGGPRPFADFREAYEVQRVVDAARFSSVERRWVALT